MRRKLNIKALNQKFETLLECTNTDFNRYLYEKTVWDNRMIGGKNKNQRQIEQDGKSFIVKDDIEFGYLNVIPLWAFGMNY